MANLAQIIVWERMREKKGEKKNWVNEKEKERWEDKEDEREKWVEKRHNDKGNPKSWDMERGRRREKKLLRRPTC